MTVLLSGCRKTFISTAGFAFAVTATYTGLIDRETAATSPIVTGAPSGVVFTTISETSSSDRAWPLTRLKTS